MHSTFKISCELAKPVSNLSCIDDTIKIQKEDQAIIRLFNTIAEEAANPNCKHGNSKRVLCRLCFSELMDRVLDR